MKMSAAVFLDWTLGQAEGPRRELIGGHVATRPRTAAERAARADMAVALRTALRLTGLDAEVFADGQPLRVDDQTVYAPDVTLTIGGAFGAGRLRVAAPVIVADVSASATETEAAARASGFFRVDSVTHALLLDVAARRILVRTRGAAGVASRSLADGALRLDPPGLSLAVADCFVTDPAD